MAAALLFVPPTFGRAQSRRKRIWFNPNSEVARPCGKKPLTWLATLATLSPRERAEINQR
jgi:hypothetical protein